MCDYMGIGNENERVVEIALALRNKISAESHSAWSAGRFSLGAA